MSTSQTTSRNPLFSLRGLSPDIRRLVITGFVEQAAVASYLAVITPWAKQMGYTAAELGGLTALLQIVSAIVSFGSGFLADWLGRKRMYTLGQLFRCVVPIILLTMHNYTGLVLVFIARGLCTVQFPARDTILAAHTARANRATMIGVNQALSQLSQVVVPIAIGVLADRVGVQLPFAIGLVLCVAAVLIALPLRERPVAERAAAETAAAETAATEAAVAVEPSAGSNASRSSLTASIKGMFGGGRALPLTLLLAATMFNGLANGATNIMLPFTIMDRFSSGYTFVNALSAVMSFGSMIVLLFGGRLADLKGRKAIIMFSGVLFPVTMLGILYAGTVWQFGLLLLVVSMLGNVSGPAVSAVYMEAVSEEARATFAGAYMGINAAAMAIGSAVSGRIYASNTQLAWYCVIACFALWTACFLFALPADRRAEAPVLSAAE